MATELDIWVSPLTSRIYIGSTKKTASGYVAVDKKDVTAQCINGAVMHLVETNDLDIVVALDNKKYRVTIVQLQA
jgi:hypothetical protein